MLELGMAGYGTLGSTAGVLCNPHPSVTRADMGGMKALMVKRRATIYLPREVYHVNTFPPSRLGPRRGNFMQNIPRAREPYHPYILMQ